eukprot:CAMPEP_0182482550 /NCGR_PEP_ID=MMETSP1319-20130603/39488_1 /TAXON_ID=172717 /ORGANISM="Bolidomonas pacifica, Strain RCC208" /LENGTH=79 /DNA_ID=CAMNT_0024684269 /DNA_START=12 /DNA_END=247 /DNA_ORIENTATION=-
MTRAELPWDHRTNPCACLTVVLENAAGGQSEDAPVVSENVVGFPQVDVVEPVTAHADHALAALRLLPGLGEAATDGSAA